MLGFPARETAVKLRALLAERRDRHLAKTLLDEANRIDATRPPVSWGDLAPVNRAVYLGVAKRARAEIRAGR